MLDEPAINEVFEYRGHKLKCLEVAHFGRYDDICMGCYFDDDIKGGCGFFKCAKVDRKDKKNVYFKEVDNKFYAK